MDDGTGLFFAFQKHIEESIFPHPDQRGESLRYLSKCFVGAQRSREVNNGAAIDEFIETIFNDRVPFQQDIFQLVLQRGTMEFPGGDPLNHVH